MEHPQNDYTEELANNTEMIMLVAQLVGQMAEHIEKIVKAQNRYWLAHTNALLERIEKLESLHRHPSHNDEEYHDELTMFDFHFKPDQ